MHDRHATHVKLRIAGSIGLILVCLAAGNRAQATDPAEAVKLLREAQAQLAAGKYAEAGDKARRAVELAGDSVGLLQLAAETLYLSGHSQDSLPVFERVVKLAPDQAPYNWQRGIALCSCGHFEDGAEQFKTHHDVNPDDVENSAWYFLCIAKTKGIDAARQTVIPSRGDGRQPMMSVLAMLQGKLEPAAVLAAADENTIPGASRQRARFYAALYVGLYYDALDDAAQAAAYLDKALQCGIDGYMADTARVYRSDRFPVADAAKKN